MQRREDARLLTGHGRYVDDVPCPGMLHVAFVRSDVARGTITALDVSAARELPGVVAVFTGADLNGDVAEAWVDFEGGDQGRPFRMLADGDVRFAGEPVVLVVAESPLHRRGRLRPRRGRDRPDPRHRRPRRRARAAARARSTPSGPTTSPTACPHVEDDEFEQVFASAAHVVTETFRQHRYLCVPMECRGVVSTGTRTAQELRRAHLDPGPPRRARVPARGRSACPRTGCGS